jgi:hypothetical protein
MLVQTVLVPCKADATLMLSMPVRKGSVRTDSYSLAMLSLLGDDELLTLHALADALAFLCAAPVGVLDGRDQLTLAVSSAVARDGSPNARALFGLSSRHHRPWIQALLGPATAGRDALDKIQQQLVHRCQID